MGGWVGGWVDGRPSRFPVAQATKHGSSYRPVSYGCCARPQEHWLPALLLDAQPSASFEELRLLLVPLLVKLFGGSVLSVVPDKILSCLLDWELLDELPLPRLCLPRPLVNALRRVVVVVDLARVVGSAGAMSGAAGALQGYGAVAPPGSAAATCGSGRGSPAP